MSVKQFNQNPLNQLCRKALVALGQVPSPNILHSLQLAIWALENFQMKGPWARNQQDLLDHAQALGDNLGRAQVLLFQDPDQLPEEGAQDEAERLKDLSPEDLAAQLLENLAENLGLA